MLSQFLRVNYVRIPSDHIGASRLKIAKPLHVHVCKPFPTTLQVRWQGIRLVPYEFSEDAHALTMSTYDG